MSAPLRILCIEDNPVNWRLVQRLLGQAGYEMHWAEEGLKGFDMALLVKPALVLLDINLPGLSGFEIAIKFKQHPELIDIPVVALTAKTLKSDRETALVAGCDGFIPKPIDPFNFVKQVEGYLRGQRERVEKSREEKVLRQFNAQMLAHLEAQLREAQEANRKLLDAQQALEHRNRSLSRLLAASHDLFGERDSGKLIERAFAHTQTEGRVERMYLYRLDGSGGYWDGHVWWDGALHEAPTLPLDHPFLQRAASLTQDVLSGEALHQQRIWDEGLALDCWHSDSECSLIMLRNRELPETLWGFWTFERSAGDPFRPHELEVMTLQAKLAQISIENAERIHSLDESNRALASSYERMENAFLDLQKARADLNRQDRQDLLEDLFVKITHRLERPVNTLQAQSRALAKNFEAASPEAFAPVAEIREAVAKIDGLLKALLRRAGREGTRPEWLDLHDLFMQEAELLEAEGVIPAGVQLSLHFEAPVGRVYGVYSDFARLFQLLVQHALGGPTASITLNIRSWGDEAVFHLECLDEGGPIPPTELERAFEPFMELHHATILGVRALGQGLASCKQILASYLGEIEIQNEGEGTLVHFHLPLV